ncbi:MAG TPA: response regulator, partial [Myxococcaceae bacterium]|nr:response regulator [Myxococcaceae bacterium]
IVEDDSDLRETVAGILADAGRTVLQAVSGADALAKLQDLGGPCLVLLDVTLPSSDSLAFLKRLGQDPHGADSTVVLMSGHSDLSAVEKYPSVIGTLQKPFDIDELFTLVNAHC